MNTNIPKIKQLLQTCDSVNVILALELAKQEGWSNTQIAEAWIGHYNEEQFLGLDIMEYRYSILHTPLKLGIFEFEDMDDNSWTTYSYHTKKGKNPEPRKVIKRKPLDTDIVLEGLETMIDIYYKKYDK